MSGCPHAEIRLHGRPGQRQELAGGHARGRSGPDAHQRRRHLPLERAESYEDGCPGTAHHGSGRTGPGRPGREDARGEGVAVERRTNHDWNYGFVIDGFPRNARQAEFFLESYDIDSVIHLDLPDSEVRRRVLARRLCSGCGMDYNLIQGSPTVEGKCDACGGTLITREDDTEEALAVRLRDYHEKTDPVLALFRRKEYVVVIEPPPDG